MKAQVNIEFMISSALTIAVIGFILLSIMNRIPVIHRQSFIEVEKLEGFVATQAMIQNKGLWKDSDISNVSVLGFTNDIPYILNKTKILSINRCNMTNQNGQTNYTLIKRLLGISEARNFVLNISKINMSGGPDEKISDCSMTYVSIASPLFWIKRIAVLDEGETLNIIRIEFAIY